MADENKIVYYKVEVEGSNAAKQAALEIEAALKRVNEEKRQRIKRKFRQ